MRDRLSVIKQRAEYARHGEPGRGQEDLYWLIGEIERLRQRIETIEHIALEEAVR